MSAMALRESVSSPAHSAMEMDKSWLIFRVIVPINTLDLKMFKIMAIDIDILVG